jgi:hypothetical protein
VTELKSKEVIKMVTRERLIEKIKSLPEDELGEVADFIEFLEERKAREPEPMPESAQVKETDPLARVIGICEGPSDLAERHDKYVYGVK